MTRKQAVKEADKWASLYIRERDRRENNGKCFFCKTRPIENCFHFFSRKVYATRWEEINMAGSCRSCNFTMEFSPYQFYKWFADNYGQFALDQLHEKHKSRVKMSTAEIVAIAEKYKKMYEEL